MLFRLFVFTVFCIVSTLLCSTADTSNNHNVQKFEFQAEVTRLMDIIIHSLYSHRDIFLRELISNSADALDKYRYNTLSTGNIVDDSVQLKIELVPNKIDRTLTIRDTGIGMTKSDLQNYLGIIASSGTSEFMRAATSGNIESTNQLIGQFGVGFYSVYLVADTVDVISRSSITDEINIWRSNADKTYTIESIDNSINDQYQRGTSVILHLKDDCDEYLDETILKKLVHKYSEFISHPIYLQTITQETITSDTPNVSIDSSDTDDLSSIDIDSDDGTSTSSETRDVTSFIRLNDQPAIWTRPSSDVTDEEYHSFYRVLNKKDTSTPLRHIHFKAEGDLQFSALLYIPSVVDATMYNNLYNTEYKSNIKLYVNKVLISDEIDILPKYLSFVHGVVDVSNFALNVNREMLSDNNKVLQQIGNKIQKKIIDLLVKMSNDDEQTDDYNTFYSQFAPSIKLGIIDDKSNKSKLAELLRFKSSQYTSDQQISLNQYIKHAGEHSDDAGDKSDKNIYYLSCESYESCNRNIVTERLKKLNYNILYFVDNLDEYAIQNLPAYKKYKFINIAKENFKIKEISKQQINDAKQSIQPLITYIGDVLKDYVLRVEVSARAVDSPAVLVSTQYGYSANMERLLKSQSFTDKQAQAMMLMNNKKILEINPYHPIIKQLNAHVDELDNDMLNDSVFLLYHTAAVTSGYTIDDTQLFANKLNRLLARSIGVDPDQPVDDEIKPLNSEEIKLQQSSDSADSSNSDSMPQMMNFDDIDMNDIEGSLAAMNEKAEHDEL